MWSARYVARPCSSTYAAAKFTKPVHHTQLRSAASLPALKIYSLRRRIAERISNKYDPKRVDTIGPDLACLEWLMNCGSTQVNMSDSVAIGSIRQMKDYLPRVMENHPAVVENDHMDLSYENRWPQIPKVHIVKVDASDSAIANEGFQYFRDLRSLEGLKLNFCDYFGDEALRELAMGRAAHTLRELEIVLNPSISDGAVYWLSRLKALRKAHFYFLPYVTNRASFLRQLKMALPKCQITFPEVENIGYGYEKKN